MKKLIKIAIPCLFITSIIAGCSQPKHKYLTYGLVLNGSKQLDTTNNFNEKKLRGYTYQSKKSKTGEITDVTKEIS